MEIGGRDNGDDDDDDDDNEDGGETEIAKDGRTPLAMRTVPGNEGYREASRSVGGVEIIPNRGAGWLAGWS